MTEKPPSDEVRAQKRCPRCEGSGAEPLSGMEDEPCSRCDGRGTVEFVRLPQNAPEPT